MRTEIHLQQLIELRERAEPAIRNLEMATRALEAQIEFECWLPEDREPVDAWLASLLSGDVREPGSDGRRTLPQLRKLFALHEAAQQAVMGIQAAMAALGSGSRSAAWPPSAIDQIDAWIHTAGSRRR